jgi:hypothetical protein
MAYKSGLGYLTTGGTHQLVNGDVGFFTVTGLVVINLLFAVCTIVGGANTAGFYAAPTGLTRVAYCVGADINAMIVGDSVVINSVAGTLTTAITGVSAAYRLLAPAGVVGMFGSAADTTLTAHCYWQPLTPGSNVVLL